MRQSLRHSALLATLLSLGCASPSAQKASLTEGQLWVGAAIRQASLDRAIVAERTIYPFHFVAGSADLNDLGSRDLGVLARHAAEHGGTIQLHRGRTSFELYAARTRSVRAALQAQGVDLERVAVVDEPPFGPGISGRRAARDVTEEPQPAASITDE